MNVEINCDGKFLRYINVKNLKDGDDGWLEFDCDGAFNEVFPIISSLLNYHKTAHIKVKGDVVIYKN